MDDNFLVAYIVDYYPEVGSQVCYQGSSVERGNEY